jgi:hypothetical protein
MQGVDICSGRPKRTETGQLPGFRKRVFAHPSTDASQNWAQGWLRVTVDLGA